jgi:hypothetical protein
MFQNLLADEFKLKFHKESWEAPVYAQREISRGCLEMWTGVRQSWGREWAEVTRLCCVVLFCAWNEPK